MVYVKGTAEFPLATSRMCSLHPAGPLLAKANSVEGSVAPGHKNCENAAA